MPPLNLTLMEFSLLVTAIVNFAAGYLLYFFRTRRKLKKHNKIFQENLQTMEAVTELNKKLLHDINQERGKAAAWKNEALILRKECDRIKEFNASMKAFFNKK